MQWSARLLVLAGAVVSGTLAVLALVFAGEIVAEMVGGQALGRKERREWGLLVFVFWIIGVLLAMLPALAMAALAARVPRVLPLRCQGCGWSETYVMPQRKHEPARPGDSPEYHDYSLDR